MNHSEHHCSRYVYAVLSVLVTLVMSPAAFANHLYEQRMDEVRSEAHQVARDANQLHAEAERYAHHGDWQEENALRALHDLDESAEHFHNQVESYYQTPYHTESDFQRLQRDYYTARATFPQLHAYSYVRQLMQRLDRSMSQLTYLYETVDNNYGGGNGGYNGGHGGYCQHTDSYGNCLDYCQHVDQYGRCQDNDPTYGGGHHGGGNHGGHYPQPGHPGCYRYDQYGNCIDYGNGGNHGGGHYPGNGGHNGGYHPQPGHGNGGHGGGTVTCYGPPNDRKCYHNPLQ